MLSAKVRGVLLAGSAAALFGMSTPLAKLLLGAMDPVLLASLFYLGSGITFSALTLAQRNGMGKKAGPTIKKKDLANLAFVVLFGGIAGPLCLMTGLARSDAAAASLLLNLEAVATAAIAWVFFQENCDRRVFLGMVAITAGGAALSVNSSFSAGWPTVNLGSCFIVLACICWAIDNNFTRQIADAEPMQIALVKGLAAGTVNFVLAMVMHQHLPAPLVIFQAMLVGFLGYGMSLVLYIRALRDLGTARSSAYFATAPFLGALLSIAIFHDAISPALLVAALLMAAGVYLHISEKHEHTHLHELMEHEHEHVHDMHHRHEHAPVNEPAGGLDSGISHSHKHVHEPTTHSHVHYPDLHHRHDH